MDDHLQKIQEMSKVIEDRPVWDSFGDEGDDPEAMYNRFKNSGVNYRAMYHTTNSEYGRFQAHNARNNDTTLPCRVPTEDGVSRSLELLGSRPPSQRDPGADARSRAADLEMPGTGSYTGRNGAHTGAPSTSGVRLPALSQYMPLKGADGGGADDAERRRLTTGFAKSYMVQSHAPLWSNLQTVAEGAGFDTSAARRPDTQVLTIDRSGEAEYAGDDNREYDDQFIADILAGIKADTSVTPRPGSAASSAKFGNDSRMSERQNGF